MKKIREFFIEHKKQIVFHAFFFLCFLIFQRAEILHLMKPFAIAFAFALVASNVNGFIVTIEFFVSSLLFCSSFEQFICFASASFCILLLFLISKFFKKKVHIVWHLFLTVMSQCAFLYFNSNSLSQIIISIVSVFISTCFVYIFKIAISTFFSKGLQCRFASDENLCLSAFCIAFFCGLTNIFVFNVNISVAIVTFLILCVSRSFSKITTLCFASLAGFGFAFYSSSLVFEAIFACFAIVLCLLSENKRIFLAFMILILDGFFGCFFNVYVTYNFFSLLPLLVVLLIFLCVPKKYFMMLKNFSFAYEGSLIFEFLVSGEKELLKNRLHNAQMLFLSMQNEYRNLGLASAEKKQACEMLSDDIVQKVCEFCPNKNFCKEKKEINDSIFNLFEFGIEKGKVSLIDANNVLSENCVALSNLIFETNSRLKSYFEFEKTVCENNQGKMMISEQLGATANIFGELEKTSFVGIVVDKLRSKTLFDELLKRNVVVNECVVLAGNKGVEKVVLAVRNKDVLSPEILMGLKSIFKIEFAVKEQKMSKYSGWTIASFIPSERYVLSIGFATNSKEEGVSGDNLSIQKIDDNRYLFAISDGMGHGKKANEISTTTLNLVENFYKSGFSSGTIISSLNKILLPRENENFVTLDVCVVDVSQGVADFVKMGASVSVIKSKNQCKMVYADSLPLGITNISSPKIQTVVLKEQDVVVLASDGIVDSFDSVEDFVAYVNNQNVVNVQMLADDVLEESLSRTRHSDDMTVVVFKISASGFSA